MKYHNPLRILQAQPEEWGGSSSRFFKRVKRRWLAEFELQDAATVVLGEQPLDRDQFLKLLDQLSSTTDLAYHLQLLRYPRLMDYLEESATEVPLREVGSALIQKGMEAYLLPYLLPRLQEQLATAVGQQQLPELLHLARVADGLSPQVQAEWFQPLIRSLLDWLKEWRQEVQRGEDVVVLHRRMQDKQEVLRLLPPYFEKMLEMYHREARHLKGKRPPIHQHQEVREFLSGTQSILKPRVLRDLLKDSTAWDKVLEQLLERIDLRLLESLQVRDKTAVILLSACLRELPEADRRMASKNCFIWLDDQCAQWIIHFEAMDNFPSPIPPELDEQLDLWAHLPVTLQPPLTQFQRDLSRISTAKRPKPTQKRPWFLWGVAALFFILILIAIFR